jgi:hypothetical protein
MVRSPIVQDEDGRSRRHAPDFFARRADGGGVVVDVRPDDRIPPEDAEVFRMTAIACGQAGWEFRRAGTIDPPRRPRARAVGTGARRPARYRHADRPPGAPVTSAGPVQTAAAPRITSRPVPAAIDDLLQAEFQAYPPQRQPAKEIHRELVTRHEAEGISYQMVRAYVGRRRTVMQQQPLSPAHQAVAEHDLARLRDLLDAGHDIEDDSGDGWTLLRRAIHAEAARLPAAGDPLHADMITFLLVRGANPQAPGKPAEAEAELLEHWLAAEIIRAWTQRPR